MAGTFRSRLTAGCRCLYGKPRYDQILLSFQKNGLFPMFRGILQIRVHDMAELVEQGLPRPDTEPVVAVALVQAPAQPLVAELLELLSEVLGLEKYSHDIPTLPIVIEDDVWIGAHSLILKGVHIGARSIIAAGSVVTSDIPSDSIAGGNPAKVIRKLC